LPANVFTFFSGIIPVVMFDVIETFFGSDEENTDFEKHESLSVKAKRML